MASEQHGKLLLGERRFVCECGARFKDGGHAVEHSFHGHEVVIERFSGGQWVFDSVRKPVMQMIIDRLRAKGESLEDFTKRLMARLDELEKVEGVE